VMRPAPVAQRRSGQYSRRRRFRAGMGGLSRFRV
jgi:hypothetical protein